MPTSALLDQAMALIEEDHSKQLGLEIGSQNIHLGEYIPVAGTISPSFLSLLSLPSFASPIHPTSPSPNQYPEAQSAPELSYNAIDPTKTYLIISLDLDAPFPSFPFLSPILHWIQSRLKVEDRDGSKVLKSEEAPVVSYLGPAPPPGSSAHRYTFFLFEEPEGFETGKYRAGVDGKAMSMWGRVRFDLDKWAEGVGLEGTLVAGSHFWSN